MVKGRRGGSRFFSTSDGNWGEKSPVFLWGVENGRPERREKKKKNIHPWSRGKGGSELIPVYGKKGEGEVMAPEPFSKGLFVLEGRGDSPCSKKGGRKEVGCLHMCGARASRRKKEPWRWGRGKGDVLNPNLGKGGGGGEVSRSGGKK